MMSKGSSIDVDHELEWDLREARIEFILQLVMNVRKQFMNAQQTKNQDYIRKYHTLLTTLFTDIKPYLEDEGVDTHDIQDQLDTLDGRIDHLKDPSSVLEELRDIDLTINKGRINAGLDIPVRDKIEYGKNRGNQQ